MKFSNMYRNNHSCRARVSFRQPFYSQLTLRIFAVWNRLGGGAQTDFVPGRGKP